MSEECETCIRRQAGNLAQTFRRCSASSPDGRVRVIAHCDGRVVAINDQETGVPKILRVFQRSIVAGVSVHPTQAVVAWWLRGPGLYEVAQIFDLTKRRKIAEIPVAQGTVSVGFNPQGQLIEASPDSCLPGLVLAQFPL